MEPADLQHAAPRKIAYGLMFGNSSVLDGAKMANDATLLTFYADENPHPIVNHLALSALLTALVAAFDDFGSRYAQSGPSETMIAIVASPRAGSLIIPITLVTDVVSNLSHFKDSVDLDQFGQFMKEYGGTAALFWQMLCGKNGLVDLWPKSKKAREEAVKGDPLAELTLKISERLFLEDMFPEKMVAIQQAAKRCGTDRVTIEVVDNPEVDLWNPKSPNKAIGRLGRSHNTMFTTPNVGLNSITPFDAPPITVNFKGKEYRAFPAMLGDTRNLIVWSLRQDLPGHGKAIEVGGEEIELDDVVSTESVDGVYETLARAYFVTKAVFTSD
jgi:hypothetical protein